MMPQSPKYFVFALIAVGFICLIGAHFAGTLADDPTADTGVIVSFLLTAAGTVAFVAAGVLALRLLRSGGWR